MTRYAVIGDPVQHSLSPRLFQLFAEQTGCRLDYQAIPIKSWDLSYALARFRDQGYGGLNVTAPLKEKAFSLMHYRSERAKAAGAVNIISFRDDGAYEGDNSDGLGLMRDFGRLSYRVRHQSILILGAGGAVKGTLAALLQGEPEKIVIANRTEQKAKQLAEAYQKENYPVFSCGWNEIANAVYDVVIQATAAPLRGEHLMLPSGILRSGAYCYDLIYGKAHQSFLQWAEAEGASMCADGLGMLVEQAAEAFYLWRQRKVDTEAIIQHLRT